MVGMRDVARKAGTSVSTVSLVVNGTGYVSDEMRRRVREAMDALGYIPNELARNFYRNRTNMIGVIVPTVRHPFFATLVAALQREFSARGMRVILCSVADTGKDEAEYVDMLRRRMMDGIVMASHTEHPAGYWTSIGRPVVAFDRELGPGIPTVRSDHEQGGRIVARLLIGSGVRHVAMIGGPRAQFHDRAGGVAAADGGTTFPTVRYYLTLERELEAAGVRHDYVEAGDVSDFHGTVDAVRRVFDRIDAGGEPTVDAVVCSDVAAALCVQEAARRGIDVPGDLQIIAYDGTYLVDVAGLRLTTVAQDFGALAAALADDMMHAIEGADGADGAAGGAADGVGGGIADGVRGGVADGARADDTVIPMTLREADSTR